MLITGIIIFCWGITIAATTIIDLCNFPWANISTNISSFINLALLVVETIFFLVAGLTAIFAFFIATPTRIRKLNVYANILFFVSLVIAIISSIFLIINIANGTTALSDSVFAIVEIVVSLILPLVYLLGARMLRKSMR